MPKVSPARKSAFDILLRIANDRSFSSILLPIYEDKLEPRDAALCHEITLGVLRNKFYLDTVISTFTKKTLKKFDVEVITALQIGLYQLYFLERIPAYSIINESVNLVKAARKKSASGFVNAVLRRASREKIDLKFSDELEKISIENSHPRWLIRRWSEQFGIEAAKSLAAANNKISRLAFRTTNKFLRLETEQRRRIIADLNSSIKITASEVSEGCYIAMQLDSKLRGLAKEGLIYFQDEASQLIANAVSLRANESFIDVCASPGSKFTQIVSITKRAKISVAGDFYAHRINILRENCLRQEVTDGNIVRYDAERSLPFADGSFDVVLIDAPCSGTGTIGRNPEIRYFLDEADLEELTGKQLTILENASKLIKTGGRVVYSTCSIEREENEAIVNRFLTDNRNFVTVKPDLPEGFLTSEGYARTFPGRDDTDGFFIAILKRFG